MFINDEKSNRKNLCFRFVLKIRCFFPQKFKYTFFFHETSFVKLFLRKRAKASFILKYIIVSQSCKNWSVPLFRSTTYVTFVKSKPFIFTAVYFEFTFPHFAFLSSIMILIFAFRFGKKKLDFITPKDSLFHSSSLSPFLYPLATNYFPKFRAFLQRLETGPLKEYDYQ